MNALLILVPISLVWIALALAALIWAVRGGQFNSLDSGAFLALELLDYAPETPKDPKVPQHDG